MKKRQKLLTDEQWKLIEPLHPKPKRRCDKRGRPPAPNRACFEGIPWVLQTGAAWRFLPTSFHPLRLAGGDCRAGNTRVSGWTHGVLCWGPWMSEACSNGKRPSWTAASRRRKRGAPQSSKPSAARDRSRWYWSTVRVFRWEFGWKVPISRLDGRGTSHKALSAKKKHGHCCLKQCSARATPA